MNTSNNNKEIVKEKKFDLRIDEELLHRFKDKSKECGKSASEQCRDLIKAFIESK